MEFFYFKTQFVGFQFIDIDNQTPPEYITCFQKISSLFYTFLFKLSSLYAIHFNMQQIRLNCNLCNRVVFIGSVKADT